MNAIEKLRAIVRATEGKDELDPVHGLAVGDCADLLREFDALQARLKDVARAADLWRADFVALKGPYFDR